MDRVSQFGRLKATNKLVSQAAIGDVLISGSRILEVVSIGADGMRVCFDHRKEKPARLSPKSRYLYVVRSRNYLLALGYKPRENQLNIFA